jgi:hypothetical protein
MNFEDLQLSWKTQPVKDPGDTNQLKLSMETSWNKHQRKVLRTNSWMSLCFVLTCIGIGFVYVAYLQHFGWAFQLSIVFVYLLMFVYLAVSWKSYGFRKEKRTEPSTSYISYQLEKLKWQRKMITTYSQVYALLLWLDIMCYTWEVTAKGTVFFRFSALFVFTAYIAGVSIWQRRTKQKKALQALDMLISDFRQLSIALEK